MRASLPTPVLAAVFALCVACVSGREDGASGGRQAADASATRAPVGTLAPPVIRPRSLEGAPVDGGAAPDRLRDLSAPSAWGAAVAAHQPEPLVAEGRTAALELRSQRRVFEGAPPPMRHSVEFVQGSMDCLDCHREGMWLGKRLAHPMSHEPLPNCLQCHVEAENDAFSPAPTLPDNSFEGLATRVPPAVPHDIGLRESCANCHEAIDSGHGTDTSQSHAGLQHEHAWWPAVPPSMPHGSGDEGQRDCMTCHVLAVDESVPVAHPMGRARFADCIACHRGDAHEPFGAPRVAPGQLGALPVPPAADVDARADCIGCHVFATTSGTVLFADAPVPPRIPHGTFLRTRCLSCHGEFGYEGLKTEHVHRSQCVQCHLPMQGPATVLESRPPTAFR